MNKAELKSVEAMLGYRPNDAMQVLLLEQVKAGKKMQEAVAQYVMPEMAILNDEGLFKYEGEMITPQQWEQRNPLGSYGTIIVIRTRK